MGVSSFIHFSFLLLAAKQWTDFSSDKKKANAFLTTKNNASLSADRLYVEEKHLSHIWKWKFIFLSVTVRMAKGHLITCKQLDKMII